MDLFLDFCAMLPLTLVLGALLLDMTGIYPISKAKRDA